jgi:hypothetical protein
MSDLVSLAVQLQAALARQDEAALRRIIDAYQDRVDRLEGDIDALARDLAATDLTAAQIYELASYQRLMRDAQREMNRFQEFLLVEVGLLAAGMIDLAITNSGRLMQAAGVAAPALMDADAISALLGFLDPAGPLYARLSVYGEFAAKSIGDLILASVKYGQNPRQIARWIVENGFGVGLTDALRITRTVQLYSYREATRANYLNNSDTVLGWIWYAQLDDRVCMSCVAMHGTIHGLDETLNDHHNGRCAMIPYLGGPNPVKSGEEWFTAQSLATQKALLGPGKFGEWMLGNIEIGQLTKEYTDDVYGVMRAETPLKELVP